MKTSVLTATLITTIFAGPAFAQNPVITTTPVATAAPAPPPPPYSLPWQLRPVTVATVLRSDNSFAFYDTPMGKGTTLVSSFLATYKLTPELAPLIRLAVAQNSDANPAVGSGGAFVNPILGVTYARKLGSALRGAAFLGITLPVGMGGSKKMGDDPTAAAIFRAIAARSAMDNAMFAVNYTTLIGGAGVAYVAHKLTAQVEATVLQLFRVRNEAIAPEPRRTNFTMGLHVGYFALSFLSVGAELRHQRWLSTPASVRNAPVTRDTTTVAIGPRFHVKAAGVWFRPGLSYATALDLPLKDLGYHILQVDVPVIF